MQNPRGFTLIELLVVLGIIALLATIAIPSYSRYILRSHRVEATTALLQLAAAQEKFYLQNNTYTDNVGPQPDGLGLSADDDVWLSDNGWYEIAVTDADTARFEVTATVKDGSGQERDTDCTTFTLNSAGERSASGTKCWD